MDADFATAVAGAAATLVGLLFVALALNPAIMADDGPAGLRIWSGQTFHNFLIVLVIALVGLVPDLSPHGLGITLLIIGGQGVVRVARDVLRARGDPDPSWRGQRPLWRFASPAGAYAICLWVAVRVWTGDAEALDWLIAVVFLLVISAAGSCWDLLKAIGDRHRKTTAGTDPSSPPERRA